MRASRVLFGEEIKDLKEFIKIMRREKKHLPKAEKITIKKNKKTTDKPAKASKQAKPVVKAAAKAPAKAKSATKSKQK